MDQEQALKKITDLRKELDDHNYKYYVLNQPVISDFDFDMKLKELEKLEKEHPEFHDQNSPTQRVGSDISKEFVQVQHRYTMLSLGNAYSEEELREFDARIRRLTDSEFKYTCELKFDGSSISLTYENGLLMRAVTRGDGTKGDDVTTNVRTIRSIPLALRGNGYPSDFEIRGEIVMPFDVFEKLNEEREKAGEALFANPRNSAAGSLKMLNSAQVAARNLDAYFYSMLGENLPSDSHYQMLQNARKWGFKIADATRLCKNLDEVIEFINKWEIERHQYPVATDGVVIKVDSRSLQNELGFTAKSPRWAIAYKYKAESAATVMKSVSYQVGRTGAVTPVANLDPVQIAGTVVKRASLHNADIIKKLDLHYDDTVFVEKGGEIIPKITGVVNEKRHPMSQPVVFINKCPECGTTLTRNEGEAAFYCPNDTGCPPQIKGRIEHYVSRKAMDIDGLGQETIEWLYNSGMVKGVADLYRLDKDKLVSLERIQDKTAQRILQGLESSKEVPFERVLYALGIRFVGETVAKTLVRHLHTIDNIKNKSQQELENIHEIGERIAESVVEYFSNPEHIQLIEFLKEQGIRFEIPAEEAEAQSNKLQGLKFVISGSFVKHSRDELKNLIEKNGGKNISSVSKNTDYIVAGENMGPSKLEKANQLKIPVISEDDFINMITD